MFLLPLLLYFVFLAYFVFFPFFCIFVALFLLFFAFFFLLFFFGLLFTFLSHFFTNKLIFKFIGFWPTGDHKSCACLVKTLWKQCWHVCVLEAVLACFGMFRFGPTWEEALCMSDHNGLEAMLACFACLVWPNVGRGLVRV